MEIKPIKTNKQYETYMTWVDAQFEKGVKKYNFGRPIRNSIDADTKVRRRKVSDSNTRCN